VQTFGRSITRPPNLWASKPNCTHLSKHGIIVWPDKYREIRVPVCTECFYRYRAALEQKTEQAQIAAERAATKALELTRLLDASRPLTTLAQIVAGCALAPR
jgi:hypothetical protein